MGIGGRSISSEINFHVTGFTTGALPALSLPLAGAPRVHVQRSGSVLKIDTKAIWHVLSCQMAHQRGIMTTASKPDSADIVEIKAQFKGGARAGYYYVALLGLRVYEPLKIDARIRSGLSFNSLIRFQRNTAFSAREIADVIRLSDRTWARRKEAGKLQPEESDRLLRASRVFGRALELFEGDPDAARQWLLDPQPLLGNAIPLDLAATDVGAIEVERVIGRLEHGIPS